MASFYNLVLILGIFGLWCFTTVFTYEYVEECEYTLIQFYFRDSDTLFPLFFENSVRRPKLGGK